MPGKDGSHGSKGTAGHQGPVGKFVSIIAGDFGKN